MSNKIPAMWSYQNEQTANHTPSTMHAGDSGLSLTFRKYLLQEACNQIAVNVPDYWVKSYMLRTLFIRGSIAIINTDKFGVIPQECNPWGQGVMYQPIRALISNPLLSGITEPVIGKECTVIYLNDDRTGIMDMVSIFADLYALCASGVATNILNTKLAYVFAAKNGAAAQSFYKLYDRIASGEAAVVADR